MHILVVTFLFFPLFSTGGSNVLFQVFAIDVRCAVLLPLLPRSELPALFFIVIIVALRTAYKAVMVIIAL